VIYPPELLDRMQAAPVAPYEGTAFRHMFADFSPFLINTRGARWNPPEVGAIYASVDRGGAIAEAEYRISLEPFRPRAKRTVFELRVELASVLDLSSHELLSTLDIGRDELAAFDFAPCQLVGGAVAWLGHDGLLVPSARHAGLNLVVFPAAQDPELSFEIIGSEVLNDESS
jgi:RES domain-containing protein